MNSKMLERARPTRANGIRRLERGKVWVSSSGPTGASMRGCGPGVKPTDAGG
jgi:hypothetical protein